MQITFQPNDGTAPVVLGDATGQGQPLDGQRFRFEDEIQVEPYPRAEQVDTFWRKNTRTTHTFTVIRDFPSINAAEAYARRFWNSFTHEGTVILTSSDGSGSAVDTVANATLYACEIVFHGLCLELTFSYTGGKLTPEPAGPAPPPS